jgi:hypothetical protein
MDMVYEVASSEIPGIMEGTGKTEYAKCVDISTKAALREMMLPGILTIDFYRSGTSWETGLWGQQSISGRNAWRIYGWSYCLEYFGLFSKQCRRCLG